MAGLRVWAGQLGVLAPWGAITIAAPGPPWAPTSICDTGVNYKIHNSTLCMYEPLRNI